MRVRSSPIPVKARCAASMRKCDPALEDEAPTHKGKSGAAEGRILCMRLPSAHASVQIVGAQRARSSSGPHSPNALFSVSLHARVSFRAVQSLRSQLPAGACPHAGDNRPRTALCTSACRRTLHTSADPRAPRCVSSVWSR